ncbi:MAG: AsmA family protein [Rhodobacteraceae bacterium]|nr:AsmA family protein [Paracoccaceae bacterium]
MRFLLRLVVVLFAFGAVLLGGLALIPAERVGDLASRQLAQATGRSVTFDEGLRPMLWPAPGVQTGPLSVRNADWAEEGALLSADGLRVTLEPGALLRGEIVLREITILRPRLAVERSADGRFNWEGDLAAASGASTEPGATRRLALPRLIIEDGRLLWIDHGRGTRQSLAAVGFDMAWPAPDAAIVAHLSARSDGEALRARLEADSGAALIAGELPGRRLEIEGAFGRIGFDGRGGHALPAAEGRIDADFSDPVALARLIGAEAAALPPPFDRNVSVSGGLTVPGPDAVFLRGMRITAGQNVIEGDADLALGDPRPKLSARLVAGPLVLGTQGGGGTGDAGTGDAGGWSEARIDASALALLDADIALSAPSVTLGGRTFAPVDLRATLDRARLVTTFRELGLHGGRVTGEFVINNRSGLSVGGTLAAEGIALREALTQWAGYDRLSGTARGNLRFLGVGASIAAIMTSLSGEGAVEIGPGELRGVDLAAVLRGGAADAGSGRTVFDAVEARFAIEGGVARNNDLVVRSPVIGLTGRGEVDLGRRSLDYRLTPVTLGGETIGGAMAGIGLRARGPWQDVRLAPDLSGAAGAIVDRERDALRERAREALEERLREVVPEADEGLSPEEILRQRLQDEAQQQLLRLLGRQ